MAMNMGRAFNAKMMVKLTHYYILEGEYDQNNNWVPGKAKAGYVWGVITSGNKFSQFEEGQAVINTESGIRNSNYKQLWVRDKYNLSLNDKVGSKGKFFNLLQYTDETLFGFQGFLVEEAKNWSPPK